MHTRESDFDWPLGRSKGFPGWQSESADGKLRSSTPASLLTRLPSGNSLVAVWC